MADTTTRASWAMLGHAPSISAHGQQAAHCRHVTERLYFTMTGTGFFRAFTMPAIVASGQPTSPASGAAAARRPAAAATIRAFRRRRVAAAATHHHDRRFARRQEAPSRPGHRPPIFRPQSRDTLEVFVIFRPISAKSPMALDCRSPAPATMLAPSCAPAATRALMKRR